MKLLDSVTETIAILINVTINWHMYLLVYLGPEFVKLFKQK